MKKQQMASFPGKKLSRNEMKNLSGGATAAAGIWVCPIDGYDCYPNLSACRAGCSNPKSCRSYSYCP
jgi:hypothetical protein